MKVAAFVPMKLNNERLKNKNVLPFENGEPLCTYILRTLTKVADIDEAYVYCSNPAIKDYIPEGIKYLPRSESLDTSSTKINEVLRAFAEDVEADVYVLTHATAPFISAESIERGIDAVVNKGFDSAHAVKRVQEFLWKDGKPFNYQPDNIPRTQDLEPIFAETCGLYIYKRELIMNSGRRIGNNPYLIEVSEIESTDIDEQEDFQIANAIFNNILRGKI
ncbi:MAG: cytidylyltransferase domain-containing protein [Oscillospiraceae bacterium]